MMLVCRREVEIPNVLGLHLRAADRFVRLARTFISSVQVSLDGNTADGKSILELTCLAASQGARVRLQTTGPDAREALTALSELVMSGFGEDCECAPSSPSPLRPAVQFA